MFKMTMQEKLNKWIRSDKKQSLILDDGAQYIRIRHIDFYEPKLDVMLDFGDGEVSSFIINLNDAPDSIYFFDKILELINIYIESQYRLIERMKIFIRN
jgi:hypothetical protein